MVVSMAHVLVIQELVDLINQASQGTKESTVDILVDRFERRLAETRTELEQRLAETKADLAR
jgi:hypothetical protein